MDRAIYAASFGCASRARAANAMLGRGSDAFPAPKGRWTTVARESTGPSVEVGLKMGHASRAGAALIGQFRTRRRGMASGRGQNEIRRPNGSAWAFSTRTVTTTKTPNDHEEPRTAAGWVRRSPGAVGERYGVT